MEILVDTANLDEIRYACDYYPLSGVTCNPTIVMKSANPDDFFAHLRKMREIIGHDRTLHAQVIALDSETQIKEAHAMADQLGKDIYVKVPVTQEGLRTITRLKKDGFNVTATGVYDTMQAFYALAAGADYIAAYVNRMLNIGAEPNQLFIDVQNKIDQEGLPSKLLAAGFHSVGQLKDAFACGCESATASLDILKATFNNQNVINHIASFKKDWESMYGEGATLLNSRK